MKDKVISEENKELIINFISALDQELNILIDDLSINELEVIKIQFIEAGYSDYKSVMERLDRLINKKLIKEALFCLNHLEALQFTDNLEALNEPDELGKPKIESVLNIIEIGDSYGNGVFWSAEEIVNLLIL